MGFKPFSWETSSGRLLGHDHGHSGMDRLEHSSAAVAMIAQDSV
jgi:hypothetical protein